MTTTTVLDAALSAKYKAIEATFLKEWTPAQFEAIKRKIAKHFAFTNAISQNGIKATGTFNMLNDFLGLAYTSTGIYAGYWVCNVELTNLNFPNHRYIGFALTNDNAGYAILWDKDENEIILPL